MLFDIKNAERRHVLKSWISIIFSLAISICVSIAVTANLLSEPNALVQEVGLKTFRMFTVLSNILMALSAALCVPFAVDGIRNRNFHLPRWIVNLSFVAVTGVALTFFISLVILAPESGFVRIMIDEGNVFLHTLVPLASIFSFIFINDYHTVRIRTSLVAIIPVSIYATVYLICAIIIGEERGGWRDHYHLKELMPWPLLALIVFAATFGIANLIRWGHNAMHRWEKHSTRKFYQKSAEYNLPTIEDAVIRLAQEYKKYDGTGDVVVPRRIIIIFEQKYQSGIPIDELCKLYIEEFLK